MSLKYVIIEDCFPIIFGEYYQHSKFQKLGEITSAGFVSIAEVPYNREIHNPRHSGIRYKEAHCYGDSVSLGIKSKSSDKILIERILNG